MIHTDIHVSTLTGLAFNWGIPVAWISVTGTMPPLPLWVLFFGGVWYVHSVSKCSESASSFCHGLHSHLSPMSFPPNPDTYSRDPSETDADSTDMDIPPAGPSSTTRSTPAKTAKTTGGSGSSPPRFCSDPTSAPSSPSSPRFSFSASRTPGSRSARASATRCYRVAARSCTQAGRSRPGTRRT